MPTIHQALADVMKSVEAVAKSDRNQTQNFNFRGIDSVVNAVGPALREHGVIMVPTAEDPTSSSYQTRSGTTMTHVLLPVTFTLYGPDGDSLSCRVIGEAADAGDKVMSKAHSVAWRIAMLQVFAIPTDDPDPDTESHERAPATQTAPPPAHDWSALGWKDQTDHDSARAQNAARAKALEDPPAHAKWIKAQGWTLPYTADQMEDWAVELDRLTVTCVHCDEQPCVCAPDHEDDRGEQ